MKNSLKISFLTGLLFLFSGSLKAQNLEDYLQIAAENNPEVKAAYAEFEAALQEAPQVKSLPDPTLTVAAFGNMIEPGMGSIDARFQLMQMFPWFGTLAAREDVASLMAEAKFQEYLNARNLLFFEVNEKYFELYKLEQQIKFQQENQEILQNYKDLALSRVSAGGGALSDVLQTDLLRNESVTALEVLQLKKEAVLAGFNALLNREKAEGVVIPQDLEIVFKNELFGTSVSANPRLEEMELRAASARERQELARIEGMPDFGVGLDYMIMGKSGGMAMEEGGGDAIMPMVSISLPIFRGKYKAARKQAEFMAESYEQQKNDMENMLLAEMEAALYNAREAQAMLRLYEKQVESTKQVLNLLLSGYRNSSANFEEVLRVRQELLKYQLAVAGAEADYLTALARIDYLSGKSIDYENRN